MVDSPSGLTRSLPLLVGAALILVFLSVAKVIVIPVAMAVLFTFLLSPLVDWLEHHRLPRVPATIAVTVLTLGLVIALVFAVTRQIGSLLDAYPRYESNIAAKIEQYRTRGRDGLLDKLQLVVERVSLQLDRNREAPRTPEQRELARAQPVRIVEDGPFRLSQLWGVAGPLLQPVATLGLVLVLVIFMLINREDLRDRVISLVGVRQLADTTRALEDAGQRVSRYLLRQLLINIGFGVAVGIGLSLIGVPYAALWGFFAALLRYIPYLGPWLAALLPIAMSTLIARDWSVVVMTVALFGVLELITNMFVEPMVYGRSIGVSQAALLIAVAFWTWLWGPVGLVLASPLTVCLVVLGRHVPHLKFLDTLLGDRPTLSPAHRVYQRLLAHDEDEASTLFDRQHEETSLAQAYDEMLLPMLTLARIDVRAEKLDPATHERLVASAGEIIDEHRDPSTGHDADEIPADIGEFYVRTEVLATAARDTTDDLAVRMLGKLLEPHKYDWRHLTSASLATDLVAAIEREQPDVLFIASIPPGGLGHTRYVCKRLRARFPYLRIVVGRFGLSPEHVEENRRQLVEAGADSLVTGMQEALAELRKIAQLD